MQAILCAALILLGLSGCEQRSGLIENYQEARAEFWRVLYSGNGKTLYCNADFHGQQRRGINVEHVFPMSWATNGLRCGKRKQCRANSRMFNLIEADLHNLFPTREAVNKARASFRFGEIAGESRRFGNDCDFEVNRRARVAEPRPAVRGEVARAMFYMADRYKSQGLIIFKSQGEMLARWHRADPPSPHEQDRNNIIEGLQGNRNLFIDQPQELTRLIESGHFF